MGRRGPKPLPKPLRLLRNQQAGTRHPAVAASEAPVMPAGLSAAEQACWAGLVAELATVPGLMARADRGVMELLARLEPMLRANAEAVREKGATLEVLDADGNIRYVQTRPEATFLLKTGALCKSLYAELGLTPSGRCRVSLTPSAGPSKLDSFLAGRHGS